MNEQQNFGWAGPMLFCAVAVGVVIFFIWLL